MRIIFPWTKLPKPFALPMRHHGNPHGSYSWDDWKEETQAQFPVRYWFQETFPLWFHINIVKHISHVWYWIRTHTYNKYHILDLRNRKGEGFGYDWGWLDRDQAMYIACFNILRDFVELEKPLGALDWPNQEWYQKLTPVEKQNHQAQMDQSQEIKNLYDWWIKGRALEHGDAMVDSANYRDYIEALDKKDDEMLVRLMKIRQSLWT